MESRRLKQAVKALLGDYIGRKLRENSFDPKGTESSTTLDDLVHYDLAVRVALWWLDVDDGCDVLSGEIISGCLQYPDRLERQAMILSAFAGMILNSLPVEEILTLYRCKPAASYLSQNYKVQLVYPFSLSYHPLAMLGSYRAAERCRKHSQKLKRWLADREKASAPTGRRDSLQISSSSSSQSFLTDGGARHYDGSQESVQD